MFFDKFVDQFAQHGVPTMILGLVMFLIVSPMTKAVIKYIESQTSLLAQIANRTERIEDDVKIIREDIHGIKSEINNLKK